MEATAEVKLLVGLPLDKVLFLSGKVLALVDVAKLVADLLCVRISDLYDYLSFADPLCLYQLVLGALAACLKLVAAAKVAVIFPLLSAVGYVSFALFLVTILTEPLS